MRIIIVGSGKSCEILVHQMEKSEHDIIVVDKNREVVDAITDKYSVGGVCGSGASREVLLAAGADTADILISLTPVDEINLLACSMAKYLGTRYAVARITGEDLLKDIPYLLENFSLDYVLNPKQLFAEALAEQVFYNAVNRVETVLDSQALLAEIAVEKDSVLNNAKLQEIKPVLQADFLIFGVLRGDSIQVPRGDFVLKEGDVIGIIAEKSNMQAILSKVSLVCRPVRSVMLVGGGEIGRILAKTLIQQKVRVTFVESVRERCAELMELFPQSNVIFGDGKEVELLEEAGIRKNDACICLTGSDETNLLISLIAWSNDITSIIARISSDAYDKVLRKVTINVTMSPDKLTAGKLMDYIQSVRSSHSTANSRSYNLGPGMFKIHEVVVPEGCDLCNLPLMSDKMKLKKGLIIGVIQRGEETIIPKGSDSLKANDRLFVISDGQASVRSVNDLF